MINFRYHVVSLIAVFLALSIGVVLGAGPLQNAINSTDEENGVANAQSLAAQLETQTVQVEQNEEFIWSTATDLLAGRLNEKRVAVVILPGVTSIELVPVLRGLELAGATVAGEVEISERWVSDSDATYRQTLAAAVSSHLQVRPRDSSPEYVLSQGLVELLTIEGESSELVREMLTDETTTLVLESTLPSEIVDGIVLVGPSSMGSQDGRGDGGQSSDETIPDSEEQSVPTLAWTALAEVAATAPGGAVAVGQAQNPEDFIAVLRGASVRVSTVDQAGTAMSGVNAALALASGQIGAYGQQTGAAAVLAPRS